MPHDELGLGIVLRLRMQQLDSRHALRQRKQINISRYLDGVRLYDVIPFAMKGIAHSINALHFFVADFASGRIS